MGQLNRIENGKMGNLPTRPIGTWIEGGQALNVPDMYKILLLLFMI